MDSFYKKLLYIGLPTVILFFWRFVLKLPLSESVLGGIWVLLIMQVSDKIDKEG